MVKSYCVKQKKYTECVPGSEGYVKTKNGRTMMKCTCASCGITKAKFVKSGSTVNEGKKKKAEKVKRLLEKDIKTDSKLRESIISGDKNEIEKNVKRVLKKKRETD